MLCWGRKWYSSLSPVMFESYLNKSILVHPNQFLVRITPHFWNSLSGHTYVIWVAYLSICWHHLVWVFTWAGINMNELLIVLCESKPREKNFKLPQKENRILIYGAFWVPCKTWDCFNQPSWWGHLCQCLQWVMDEFPFLGMEEGGWWKVVTPLLCPGPFHLPPPPPPAVWNSLGVHCSDGSSDHNSKNLSGQTTGAAYLFVSSCVNFPQCAFSALL